jgi:hypothetical protein
VREKDVLLCSTFNDPHGVFLNVLQNAINTVLENYRIWVINVTVITDPEVKKRLTELASERLIVTETDSNQPIVNDKIENDHLSLLTQVVKIATKKGFKKIQYTDGDRTITAASHYPDSLAEMADRSSQLLEQDCYVNYRRTPADYFTHHPPLVQTELEFNRLYSQTFGLPIDIGSTAHGLPLTLVKRIVDESKNMPTVSFPHPKWLMQAKIMGLPIISEEINRVLTFETPDQMRSEIQTQVQQDISHFPYEEIQRLYMSTVGLSNFVSPPEWSLRFRTYNQYVKLLKTYVAAGLFPNIDRGQIMLEIDRSLRTMERWQKTIDEALVKSPREIRAEINQRAEHALSRLIGPAAKNTRR